MIFSQDEIKRRQYEIQEKAIRDYNSTILYNRQEGLKEGLKKGAEDKAIEIALKMLENGSDVNFIADVTGLSVEKINEIKKRYVHFFGDKETNQITTSCITYF